MDLVTIGALLLYAILNFIFTKSVEKGIQHRFDEKLENLRGDLRTKEAEISSLREGVLSGRANRQALLEKRRLEAVEKIWAAVIALGPAKAVSGVMSIVKYEAVVKDRAVRLAIERLLPQTDDSIKIFARNEQPFVSQLAWAYYFAYVVIIRSASLRADALRAGLDEPDKIMDMEKIKEPLKAALPDKAQIIATSQPAAFHDLLDELEEKLLAELKNMLGGRDLDDAGLEQAKHIIDASNKLNLEGAEVEVAIKERSAGGSV